jgi:pyruvate formate lyase activating enzyme
MTTGLLFDIKEFAVHDGPGIRTTVFLKGCPLACVWCHNPEGQSRLPQIMRSQAGERLAGEEYTVERLVALLNRQAPILKANGGGVTFSGGEPLLQAQFVAEVIDHLYHRDGPEGMHLLLDTSGYGREADLRLLLERCHLVFYDLKLIDPEMHWRYTGCDNDLILHNLQVLSASGVPFVIRVPLVPGVTDTETNLRAIAHTVGGLPGLLRVDLLAYNRAAGAKYPAAGMQFHPDYDEDQPVNVRTDIFSDAGIEVNVP